MATVFRNNLQRFITFLCVYSYSNDVVSAVNKSTTSTNINTTLAYTNLSATGTNTDISDCQCVLITEGFSWGLNGIWTESDTINGRDSYSMEYGLYGHPMMYIYWNSYWSNWDIYPNLTNDDVWYFCSQYDLNDCVEGFWISVYGDTDNDATVRFEEEGLNTPSPLIEGCTPYIETLNFYNEKMDGVWLWSDEHQEYRLNISGYAGYYKMKYDDDYADHSWNVYEVYANGEISDYLTYCRVDDMTDLPECAGQWIVWDDSHSEWIYDSAATLQLVDCSYSDCDVIGLSNEDTDRTFSTKLECFLSSDIYASLPN